MGRQLSSLRRIALECLIIQAILLLFSAAAHGEFGPTTQPLVMHFPGVGGYLIIDRHLMAGLAEGGVRGRIEAFDWTQNNPGIDALHGYDRNHKQAAAYAKLIARHIKQWPDSPIVLTSHSGGGGIAVWTLEQLPAGVRVDAAFLLAPALSPDYDLSAALRHIRKTMYVFYSQNDYLVLGAGCRLCGTMDGEFTDAAGFVGFVTPKTAEAVQYLKLKQIPYNPAWGWLGNFGDHIGPMSRPFAAKIIAPLVVQAEVR